MSNLSAEIVSSANSAIVLPRAPSIMSSFVRLLASMQVPHNKMLPLPDIMRFSIRLIVKHEESAVV
jgi:hypothetical protein